MPEQDLLPPALRKRVNAVNEALERSRPGAQQEPQETGQHEGAPEEPQTQERPPAANSGEPRPQEQRQQEPRQQEQPVDWEARFRSLEGQFTGLRETVRSLTDENANLRDALSSHQEQQPSDRRQEPNAAPSDDEFDIGSVLSEDEREDWKDLAGILDRAVKAATKPLKDRIKQLEGTTELRTKTEAQRNRNEMHAYLDREVPDWESINQNPAFAKEWLQKTETLTGQTYHKLINAAYNRNEGQRVAEFFKRFLSDTGEARPESRQGQGGGGAAAPKSLDRFAAPGKGKSAAAPPQAGGEPDAARMVPLSEYTAFMQSKALGRLRMTREEIAQKSAEYDRAYDEERIDFTK